MNENKKVPFCLHSFCLIHLIAFINVCIRKKAKGIFHIRTRAVMPAASTAMAPKQRLLLLGFGWANWALLRRCKGGGIDTGLYKVCVVCPRNHFLFTPLLASTTVGTLEFGSIVEPIREHATDLHLSHAQHIDFATRRVWCKSVLSNDEYPLEYDKLVIGVGALPNTFNLPGVRQHCFFLKELADAQAIRARLANNFERSLATTISETERERLKHIVIVGGGPTGVEFGAEVYDFCKRDLMRLYKAFGEMPRVTLIESRQILTGFDGRLQAYAEKMLAQRENFSILKGTVTEVCHDSVVLSDGRVLPTGLVVWSAGIAPQTLLANLDLQKNRQGQILVDRHLNILSDPSGNAYAIGDCAQLVDLPLPSTAQVAQKQGRYLADRLNRLATSNTTKMEPFRYKSMGMLAYIGGNKGLADLPEFKMKGFPSWLLWRSAYLVRQGSWRLRLQVPLNWLRTFFFGRDISRF